MTAIGMAFATTNHRSIEPMKLRPVIRQEAPGATRGKVAISKEGIGMSANHTKRATTPSVSCSLGSFVLLLACPSPFAHAGTPPLLEFDAPFCVGCRSIPCSDSAKKDPGKDLIEVVVPISVGVRAGSEKDLKQCLYTLVDPTEPETLSVRDWLPRTELKTEYAKPIQVNNERLAKVGINLSAHYVVSAASDASGQVKSGLAYEMLPPQETVLASGTVHQGHGVFFKLRPSSQTTLEGMKSFSAIFAVPRGWRGGCLKLRCEAVGLNRSVVSRLDREVQSGAACFCLALHLAGDEEAEKLADHVAVCEEELFDSIAKIPHEGRPFEKALAWLTRAERWAWPFDKPGSENDSCPKRFEAGVMICALDPSIMHEPPEDFPPPVREKLRAFQKSVQALQGLPQRRQPGPVRHAESVSSPQPVKPAVHAASAPRPPASTTAHLGPTIDFAEFDGAAPAPSPSGLRKDSPSPLLVEQKKSHAIEAKPEEAKIKPLALTAQPSEAGSLPKKAWYVLPSIWGAVFTSILAPLVVELIRMRMNIRRRARSRGKPTASPPSVHRVERIRVSKSGAIPMLLVPAYPDPQASGSDTPRQDGDLPAQHHPSTPNHRA
jgi:hypothetical protein